MLYIISRLVRSILLKNKSATGLDYPDEDLNAAQLYALNGKAALVTKPLGAVPSL